jgi:glycosyltransferase involved in cell wall biosynthesis
MKQKVLVKGPVLSQSGYGEQARFALRSLRSREDIFDIYIVPIAWGKTGWISYDNEERAWIDSRIRETHLYNQSGGQYDISVQVTIPNEWERIAPVNIGYTAGIETTKVAPGWLQKANEMDKIIVVSNHAKEVFENTSYEAQDRNTGAHVTLTCNAPIDVVNYPVRPVETEKIKLDLDYDFNYLAISQWGPRKNFNNLINWFIEENFDQEVGLVLKTSVHNNSIADRMRTENTLKNIISKHGDVKCKVYLIHGDLTPEEMSGLYNHSKIKCLISTAHGEGYGLPLFEAAYNGLPIIMHNWSGQSDFLYVPQKNGKRKPMFATVEYELQNVQKEAVWNGVIQADSQWAFPLESSFKKRLREVRTGYTRFKRSATKLKKHLNENFTEDIMYNQFCSNILGKYNDQKSTKNRQIQKISFCIPTNGKRIEKTKITIQSIRKEMGKLPHEIILAGNVDYFSEDKKLILVNRKQEADNRKVAALRNAAANASTGDIIAWCDDDIIIGKDWLKCIKEYSKNNQWDVLGCKILNPDGTRHWDRSIMNPRILVNYNFPSYSKNLMQTSGFFLVRKEVFDEVKWDEECLVHATREDKKVPEDVQYSIDLHKAGYEINFDSNSLVWHNDENYTQIKNKTLTLSDVEKYFSMVVYSHKDDEFNSTLEQINV